MVPVVVALQSQVYLELPWVYNYCNVVIYPTIGEEPFGLVPVEGMACAKPVVVTRSRRVTGAISQ